jgi:anti-sigma B factor antagonist
VARHNSVEIRIHSAAACIVTLRGEHDVDSRETVTLALAAARDYTNILVDLSGCTFIDSSVITTLLEAAKRARQGDGALELVVPTEANAVRRTLEIANVQGMLPFNETAAEGLASMAAGVLLAPERAHLGLLNVHVQDVAKTRAGVTVVRARVADDAPAHRVAAESGTLEIDLPGDEGQLAA